MRAALTAIALFACASSRPAEPPRANEPAPGAEQAAAPATPTDTAAAASGAMTASEAARLVLSTPAAAEPHRASGAKPAAITEDSSCATDDDCATTPVPAGGCCAMLCEPRVVSAKTARELGTRSTACGRPCPAPLCMRPRFTIVPACEAGRCVARKQSEPQ